MMNPGVPGDLGGLAGDGAMVLWVNALTGYAKEWLEDVVPESWIPTMRRGYVFLPVLCAAALCVVQDGWGPDVPACAVKYGALAAYVKMAHRSGVEGR